MNIVDVIIIIMAISAIFRGRELGLVRQIGSTVGFIGGLIIGIYLQPYTAAFAATDISKSLVGLLTILGMAFIFLGIGEYVGVLLKNKFTHKGLNATDGWLGSVVGTATMLIAVWLGAAILSAMPVPQIQDNIERSAIISRLNHSLPSTSAVITNLTHFIDQNGFPRVFIGNEPLMPENTAVPGISPQLQAAIDKSKDSVVRMEGVGCGGVVQGTGFVIAQDLVVTNAHVIAGVPQPYVRDVHGQHTATPVWFDPDLDFAIVRVNNLAGSPLLIRSEIVPNQTEGAVLGYPGGAGLTAGGAAIIDHFTARGRDIYHRGVSDRSVYSLAAHVIPGNSGGPVIDANGSVVGVIFAQSTAQENVGYALSMPQLMSAINQAQAQNRQVSTGACAEA